MDGCSTWLVVLREHVYRRMLWKDNYTRSKIRIIFYLDSDVRGYNDSTLFGDCSNIQQCNGCWRQVKEFKRTKPSVPSEATSKAKDGDWRRMSRKTKNLRRWKATSRLKSRSKSKATRWRRNTMSIVYYLSMSITQSLWLKSTLDRGFFKKMETPLTEYVKISSRVLSKTGVPRRPEP